MPRPHEERPSKLRNAASRPGDDADAYAGGWSRERLIAMDARYREAMRAALIKDVRSGRWEVDCHNGSGALNAARSHGAD